MDLAAFISQLFDRGDDPFGLKYKRDDTTDLIMALRDKYGVPEQEIMGQGPPVDEMYVSERVSPPTTPPEQNSWEAFLALNPNLDLDKVAEQAIAKGGGRGKSVPGGTFSEMPDNNFAPDHPQSDEAFSKWVHEFDYDQTMREKMDPRSRAYDPAAAEILSRDMYWRGQNSAEMLKQKAAQAEADAAMLQAQLMERLTGEGMIPTGVKQPKQTGPSAKDIESSAEAIKQLAAAGQMEGKVSKEQFDEMITDANKMVLLAIEGRMDEALAISQKYSGAPAPAGAAMVPGVPQPGSDADFTYSGGKLR